MKSGQGLWKPPEAPALGTPTLTGFPAGAFNSTEPSTASAGTPAYSGQALLYQVWGIQGVS